MTYVGGQKRAGCVFCTALEAADDAERLILHRGEYAFVILNLYPYNTGHSMVVPNQHAATLDQLDAATRTEMMELTTLTVDASRRVLNCEGFNLGMNIGEIAGAGVAEHLHLHVVPRWLGDANFMPILANTMVMPELLPTTYARLRAEVEGALAARDADTEIEAGALVVLPERGVVALRRARNGDIVLPKGHVEPGETLAQAGVREVREETGLDAAIVRWAGSLTYPKPEDANRRIFVAYFIAIGRELDEMSHHLETDTVLVPIREAAAHVQIPELRSLVDRATPTMLSLCQTGTA